MTLKEYLEETYDILGAKRKKKEALDDWNKKIKEYDEKLASVSDKEWKEAKRKTAHDIIDEVNQRRKTRSDNVKATIGLEKKAVEAKIKIVEAEIKGIEEVFKGFPLPQNYKDRLAALKTKKQDFEYKLKQLSEIDDEYKPAPTGSKIFRDPSGRKIKKKTILQKEIDKTIKDAERDRKLAKLFRNGPDDDDI